MGYSGPGFPFNFGKLALENIKCRLTKTIPYSLELPDSARLDENPLITRMKPIKLSFKNLGDELCLTQRHQRMN